MTMDASSDLGMALGSAGVTSVLMCVAINRSWGRSTRKRLSCSSKAETGDLPEGNLWRTTSKIFAFMVGWVLQDEMHQAQELRGLPRLRI